jgi:hypothetical protein
MKRMLAPLVALTLAGCATSGPGPYDAGWTTLIDGTTMSGLHAIQGADWHAADGAIVATKGVGFLMTDKVYGDFEIHAEFYAEADTNSGLYLRCGDAVNPTATVCYEVNIWDKRPKPEYGTGAIVDVAKVDPMPKCGGKWNTYDVVAKGDHLKVTLNGVVTADAHDSKHAMGPIGLQYANGVDKEHPSILKFRNVRVRPL